MAALVARGARPPGAPDFTYGEFPGYDVASRDQLDALELLAARIIQPARSALGVPVRVTSWLRSRIPGDPSVHPLGAAADLVAGNPPNKADTYNLWLWIVRNRRGQFGEAIYEQPRSGVTGHAHVTLYGYGGKGEVIYQTPAGAMVALDPFSLTALQQLPRGAVVAELGDDGLPVIPLPGFDVVVSRYPWLPYVAAGAVLAAAWYATRPAGGVRAW